MFTNAFWVLLYVGLLVAVGGVAYYIGDDRGEERGRREASLSDAETKYFDASVSRLVQLGYEWDGSAWIERATTPVPGTGVSGTTSTVPDRTTCEEIEGTPYRSPAERVFYLSTCVDVPITPTPLCGSPENPWCYDLFPGDLITTPPPEFCGYFECVENFWAGTGYVVRCNDGAFSKTGGTSDACTGHQGVRQPLYSH